MSGPYEVTSPAQLPTRWGGFQVIAFRFPSGAEHLALVKGDVSGHRVLARIHSSCVTGDVLGSERCDCGAQLQRAIANVELEGRGAILYLHQEGRGIGLFNKIRAYVEQDLGANTVEANEKLGFAADARAYDEAAQMLSHLGVRSVRLMTNNPAKVEGMVAAGIPVEERVPHEAGLTETNRLYIQTKKDLLGHMRS